MPKKNIFKKVLMIFIFSLTFSVFGVTQAEVPAWALSQINMLRSVGSISNSTSSTLSNINKLINIGIISISSSYTENIATLQAGGIISTPNLTTYDITALQNSGVISKSTADLLNSQNATTQTETTIGKNVTASSSSTNCANLTIDIKYQNTDTTDNGNIVSVLQNFLYRKGYLKTAPTGYFGSLTLSAVKAFQSANGINSTGYVGSLTRTAIQNLDCNYTNYSNTTTTTAPVVPTPVVLPVANKIDSATPTIIIEADPAQVMPGGATTLRWSTTNVTNLCKITSKNLSNYTFSSMIDPSGKKSTGPINESTTYTILCYNKYGIPGTQSLTVKTISANAPVIIDQGKYAQAGSITSITPSSGNRGDIVNIKGSNFLSINDVFFDGLKVDSNQIFSLSSTSIFFKIPEYKTCSASYCPPPATDTKVETGGQKIIQVSNINGYSNDFVFTLPSKMITISAAPQYTSAFTLSSIKPTSGNRGDMITVYGSGFDNNSVAFFGGFKVADNLTLVKTNNSISFIVPKFQMGCTDPEYEACPKLPLSGQGIIVETGGSKKVFVMNISNKSTTTSATFTLPSLKITY